MPFSRLLKSAPRPTAAAPTNVYGRQNYLRDVARRPVMPGEVSAHGRCESILVDRRKSDRP